MRANTPISLLKKIDTRTRLSIFVVGIISGLLLCGLYLYLDQPITLLILSGALLIGGLSYTYRRNKFTITDTLELANTQNESLEYSASLLNETTVALSPLQQIQKNKIETLFNEFDYTVPYIKKTVTHGAILGIGIVLLSIIVSFIYPSLLKAPVDIKSDISEAPASVANVIDKISPFKIETTQVIIKAPNYTGIARRSQSQLAITAPERSNIDWKIQTNRATDLFYMIFSDGDTLPIKYPYRISRTFSKDDFYRIGYTDRDSSYISDYQSIKIIPDEQPEITINDIDEYVRLPWQTDHQIPFTIDITDDYGIDSAMLYATVAKGSGESVKFREKIFKLNRFRSGAPSYSDRYSFSTSDLDMEPGSELYFFIRAKDNCPFAQHWTKSITHFVSIEDTTQYEYVDDASMQVDLMPDFFRSQRQIIIDSEKLLASQSSISKDSFNRMSNELGYDQKMLRLKYGQFLGEENESGIAIQNEVNLEEDDDHDHDHDHEHEKKGGVLSNARDLLSGYMHDHDHEEEEGLLQSTKGTEKREDPTRPSWVQELSHNHDNEEEATFHDVSVKSKLRAAMSEMWDSELHLRLYDPKASLPYQYRSLKLLQEIKNHARIYVHRIGFDPPAIKEAEKRLTGKLEEIQAANTQIDVDQDDPYQPIKSSINILGNKQKLDAFEHKTLSIALSQLALERPEILPVLSLMQTIEGSDQYNKLRIALLKILPQEQKELSNQGLFTLDITRQVAQKIQSR